MKNWNNFLKMYRWLFALAGIGFGLAAMAKIDQDPTFEWVWFFIFSMLSAWGGAISD